MRIVPRWLRRKAAVFALMLGSLTAFGCWWFLPPEPAYVAPTPNHLTILSADLELVAFTEFDIIGNTSPDANPMGAGTTSIYSVKTGQTVSSFSFKSPILDFNRSERAFSGDNKSFVEFCFGKTRIWNVETGQRIDNPSFAVFPYDAKEKLNLNSFFRDMFTVIGTKSTLVTDKGGNLFVLVHEQGKPSSVRDLITGKEIATFDVAPNAICLGVLFETGLVAYAYPVGEPIPSKIEVREIPSGRYLGPGELTIRSWVSPTFVFRPEILERRKMPPAPAPIYSPDGRLLFGNVRRDPPEWLSWLMDRLGHPVSARDGLLVYDLDNEKEVAFFPSSRTAQFSADSQKIAIWSGDSIDFYDLPLPRPWPKIAAYSVSVAGCVFLVGWVLGYLSNKLAQRRRERLARQAAL